MSAARKRRKELSELQIRILEVLARFNLDNGFPPSIREICEQAHVSSTSVANYHLERLEESEYIKRTDRVSRGIQLVKSLEELAEELGGAFEKMIPQNPDMLRIPIVGPIFASEPVQLPGSSFNYLDAENAVEVAASMLPRRERPGELFALEVRGDSMIDAMVYDGDIVVLKKTNEARNGDMVAVWLADRDETTLKYFYREGGRIRLQPANPTMGPIYIDDSRTLQIQGQVVMVVRSFKGRLQ